MRSISTLLQKVVDLVFKEKFIHSINQFTKRCKEENSPAEMINFERDLL